MMEHHLSGGERRSDQLSEGVLQVFQLPVQKNAWAFSPDIRN
jgi:hypothetical protein